ncbi:MAG: branched-chain amino acid ABC transporter substrate-binding protein [Candidatus Rokubacteria bacterium GWC2_70_16]|nr:MAG: branched-chain amino acid ABC transporter substrate-binding protein [Candidatus Rokubacteria bacterium GWC2_70_16]
MSEAIDGAGSVSRRNVLKGAGAAALGATLAGPRVRRATAQAGQGPLRLGFQVHRTGIGAVYGRWYERTTTAAVKLINEKGGIAGRQVEIVAEDDGTDPKRGGEVVEKLATHHKVDFVFGTLFSHVVIASAPRAGELKIPYLVVSEGYHVASGKLNRYVFQPGITDVRAQVTAMAPWILKNLGKKVTLIFPDYAFGHDHRDFFSKVATAQGGTIRALVPIPPTETSFTKYFPRVPADTEVLYHVMVGPGVLTFVKEMGEHFGAKRPQIFGFVDSLEGVDMASPGLDYLEGTYFWEAFPRYASASTPAHVRTYRERVGINDSGASVSDPKDVSTASHMFGCWETLFVIKQAVEKSGYKKPADYKAFIETLEGFQSFPEGLEHPQGPKKFVGRLHQVFGQQLISKVEKRRLSVIHRTAIEDSMYAPEADYTKQPL